MKRWARLTIVGLVIIGGGAVMFAMNAAHRHPVLTTDSIMYIDTARHIASGQGPSTTILRVTDTTVPTPQTQWPPLYAMKIAPLVYFGVDPIFAGRIVSAVAFGLTVLLVGLWVRSVAGSLAGVTAAVTLITLPGVTSISAAVWADSLYTFIVTALAWVCAYLVQRPQRKIGWFVLGSLIGLGILAKYLGILLIGFLGMTIILSLRSRHQLWQIVTRLGYAVLGLAMFTIPLLLYSVINGRPIGGADRPVSSQSLGEILSDLWNTLSRDFTATTLWVAVLTLTVSSLVAVTQRKKLGPALFRIAPIVGLTVVYWLGLVAARFLIDTDDIYTRFTMPVYPLAVVIVLFIIASAVKLFNKRVSVFTFGLLLIGSATWSIKTYDFKAGAYAAEISPRTQLISQVTTERDLIIGPASREYNLFLGRAVIHLSDDATATKLTPELLQELRHRWQNQFDRILLAVTPNISAKDYGVFTAEAAVGQPQSGLTLVHQTPALTIYSVD